MTHKQNVLQHHNNNNMFPVCLAMPQDNGELWLFQKQTGWIIRNLMSKKIKSADQSAVSPGVVDTAVSQNNKINLSGNSLRWSCINLSLYWDVKMIKKFTFKVAEMLMWCTWFWRQTVRCVSSRSVNTDALDKVSEDLELSFSKITFYICHSPRFKSN